MIYLIEVRVKKKRWSCLN